ncbi:hypothetical protein Pcinc_007854 [Petrolisthes cinctipes]|uniref:Transposase n=1 Tax=Petrolisthes cinctipes TaxID=88211 RepID=A0AAE1GA53_PETCI|nr:hypothetical protein Pcinc_007854 [Petrolisthes cinctipes]
MQRRDIADDVGVSQRTVERWISWWQEEGSLANKPRRGRPRVTAPQQDAQVIAASRNNSKKTAVSITHDLQIQCSAETTRRRLRENSINCHVPACKEVLNDNHRETRHGFALQNLGEDVNFWNHVIFSDESYFTSVEVKARHCWRQKDTRYDAENIKERAVSGRIGRNYWGWMWAYGPGELVSLEGRFTAREYIRVLEDIMLPTVSTQSPIPPVKL